MNFLIAGLGNPGKEYEKTRHNAGFMVVDAIARKYGAAGFVDKFYAMHTKITIDHSNIILLKPQTYVNLSGRSVLPTLMFYKIKPSHLWVIHDDMDLACGRIKAKLGGGHGGHNGLKSIDEVIGKEYHRLRIGVGRPTQGDVKDYVLQNFSNLEMEKFTKLVDNVVGNLELLLEGSIDRFLNKVKIEEEDDTAVRDSGAA